MLHITKGLMKSGKSKDVIETFYLFDNFYRKFDKAVEVFTYKPYDERTFVEVESRALESSIHWVGNLSKEKHACFLYRMLNLYDIIIVDEIQFAPIEHLNVFLELAKEKDVFCYGLEKNFLSEPFESMETLVEMGETFLKNKFFLVDLEAECDYCGETAEHNIRLSEDKDLIVIDKDVYKTVCSKCKETIEKGEKIVGNSSN